MLTALTTRSGATPDAADAGPGAIDRRPHAVVIGSGFGGLAAAVRLGARGYRVTVLEQGEEPGGRADRPSSGRLHVRRGADGDHRAVPVRGTVGAGRPVPRGTTWTCGRSRRSIASSSTTASASSTAAMRRRCGPRWPAWRPMTSTVTHASSPRARRSTSVGFEALGDQPFDTAGATWRKCCRICSSSRRIERSIRSRPSTSAIRGCGSCSRSSRCSSAAIPSRRRRCIA